MGNPPPYQPPPVNVNIQQPGQAPAAPMPQYAPAPPQKPPLSKRIWKILGVIEKILLYVGGAIKGARQVHEEIIEEEKAEASALNQQASQAFQHVQSGQPPPVE